MAVSGLALFAFLLVHLGGNLTLFASDGGRLFNSYAHHLESVGPLLVAAELGLIALCLLHAVAGVSVALGKRRARETDYAVYASKGGPSHQTLSSRYMIVTGLVLLAFIPLHVWMFKYNYGHGHPTVLHNGQAIKNLYATVQAEFQKPLVVWGYVAAMLLLGFHLRHAFWSALQSLGAMSPRLSPLIYAAGLVLAVLVAGGFLLLPVYIHIACPLAGGAP